MAVPAPGGTSSPAKGKGELGPVTGGWWDPIGVIWLLQSKLAYVASKLNGWATIINGYRN